MHTITTTNPNTYFKKQNETKILNLNGNEFKIYSNNTMFMDNEQEFSFRFHNFSTYVNLILIKLNNKYISKSGIIIKPGESIILERFIDTKSKFIFSQYTVDSNDFTKEAIQYNGNIEIEWYSEYIPVIYHSYYPTYGNPLYYTNTSTSSDKIICDTTSNISQMSNKMITGRIESGNDSNQKLTEVSGYKFNSFYFQLDNFKILPKTAQINIRVYCSSCGTRKRKLNWTHCPKCGTQF